MTILALLVFILPATAQEYKVTTAQTDPFSTALVDLLNCAAGRFRDCKGDSIRSTSLMGDDHKLAIELPGSSMAIVRSRDWDRNVYVEFRGFTGKKERDKGIRDLVGKIKNALGEQLYDPNANKSPADIYFYGLSVKDKNGYFSMNMELFGGSSSAPVYLLGPEKEEDQLPKKDFVLLKIYGGIPDYQYYIRTIPPPDEKLNLTLRQMVRAAITDFDSLRATRKDSVFQKRKRTDTLHLNGFDVSMNYSRANYSACLSFPIEVDSASFHEQWQYYQQVLQAALGSEYVYHLYSLQETPYVVYYRKEYVENKPRVYLELEKQYNGSLLITIRIESSFSHPTKRSVDPDDL